MPPPARLPESIQKKVSDRLRYYQDLGIDLFYRDRSASSPLAAEAPRESPAAARPSIPTSRAERAWPPPPLLEPSRKGLPAIPKSAPLPLPVAATPTLFEAADKIANDTLLKVRSDLGECTRCKLHSTRHTIVFGDGSPKAQLVFVGEGPGADEDAQGLPFVGRAGKLLTQMIEAMGLQRKDVYICNVVKCRPPGNRQPEEEEVRTCSPFLFRQIDVIAPKVIVCLGAVAAKALLETNRGISQFRGEWLECRGRKLMATYHPAYLLRNPNAKGEVWKDLQKVMAELGLEPRKSKPVC